MKRKIKLIMLIFLLSIMLIPFSHSYAYAEDENNHNVQINTIYPDDILDYVDLTNISLFTINNNYIAYTLDKSNIDILNVNNKSKYKITGFNEIKKMKFVDNNILVADSSACQIIKNIESEPTILTLSEINYTHLKAIDFYIDNNNIKIGTINNDTFNLYQYNLDLTKSAENPGKTITVSNVEFEQAYMMAINKTNAYVIYARTTTEPLLTGICTLNFSEQSPSIRNFYPNAKIIDTIYYQNIEYLITFTDEILYLLKPDCSEIDKITITTEGNTSSNSFPILKVTDIDYFDGKIYVSDSSYKTIQAFDINTSNDSINLECKKILLCSQSYDNGRFNNVDNIFISSNIIYTSDTGNDRISFIQDNKSYIIDEDYIHSPTSVLVDKYNNLYFINNSNTGSSLFKFTYSDNKYNYSNQFNTINSQPLGYISDTCVSNNNSIYLLDYTSNKILYLTGHGLEILITPTITLTNKSQIEYLRTQNKLVIFNNSNIYYVTLEGTIIDFINVPNSRYITSDLDQIYVITDNEIITIHATDENISVGESKIEISNIMDYSTMTYDIINKYMIAFDQKRSCLTQILCNLSDNSIEIDDISESKYLQISDMLIPLHIINNNPIYEYPYQLGIHYNRDREIINAIAIGEYDNYYQVLINHNNTLAIGFVEKANTNTVTIQYSPTNVIATNQIVPIYKYPTLLKYNNERLIVDSIRINTRITLTSLFPVSLDEKTFYAYNNGNNKGFVFNADIVLDESKTIKNLNTENATIKLIGKDTTSMYDSDMSTELKILDNNTRIYVENYDKNNEYTKIIYKDKNLNTTVGYVKTTEIEMDKLDDYKVVLIIIIIISILLLIAIVVTYIVIRKKKSK